MARTLKIIGLTLGIIILLAVVGIGLFVTLVSPNQFKPIIMSEVDKYTGSQLTIEGDLSWSFFPYFSVKAGHMRLDNRSQHHENRVIELNQAAIGVKLLPLLHRKIEISGISLTGVKITWTNLQTKQKIVMDNMSLSADNVSLNQPFFVTSQFDLALHDSTSPDEIHAKGVTTNINVTVNTVNNTGKGPYAALEGITLQGETAIDELQAAKLTVNAIHVHMQLQNRQLTLTPITANFYEGKLQGQTTVNFNAASPPIALSAKLINVQAEPLLADLGSQSSQLKIKGAANIDLQVTTKGLQKETILQNLNGTSHFNFQNGLLDGINLGYLLDSAYALATGKPIPSPTESVTHFGTLTGTATIHNGVISNQDLFVNSPRFDTSGQGSINLLSQQLNYNLQIIPKQNDSQAADHNPLIANHFSIPVLITGSLSRPHIQLDTEAIGKEIAKQQLHRIKDKIKNQIQEKLQDQVTSGQAAQLLQNLLGQ